MKHNFTINYYYVERGETIILSLKKAEEIEMYTNSL